MARPRLRYRHYLVLGGKIRRVTTVEAAVDVRDLFLLRLDETPDSAWCFFVHRYSSLSTVGAYTGHQHKTNCGSLEPKSHAGIAQERSDGGSCLQINGATIVMAKVRTMERVLVIAACPLAALARRACD